MDVDHLAEPVIVTEGTGWDERVADRAELDVVFAAAGADRRTAVGELAALVAAAREALSHPAVAVRHRRLHVANEWRRNKTPRCSARERLALLVTDVAALDDVLGGLVAAEPAELHGPRWALDDATAPLRRAQQRAVADARSRAEGYAAALDARLGALRRLTEVPEHSGPHRMAAMAEAGSPEIAQLGLEPEPVRVTARCTTTWSLLSL